MHPPVDVSSTLEKRTDRHHSDESSKTENQFSTRYSDSNEMENISPNLIADNSSSQAVGLSPKKPMGKINSNYHEPSLKELKSNSRSEILDDIEPKAVFQNCKIRNIKINHNYYYSSKMNN